MERCTRLDLLRHGACRDGAIYRGRTDSELSEDGWQQLLYATADGGWDRIFCSPLKRCRVFAEALAVRLQRPLAIREGLAELDFGFWDGQPLAEVWSRQSEAVMAFWRDPVTYPPPGGENMADLQQRALAVVETLYRDHPGERLLLITHSGVIRVLLAHWLEMPLANSQRLAIDYAGCSRVECYSEGDQLTGIEVRFVNRITESMGG
ncbi:histidine phosphatase family protein [Motiliproteus sediminis]|uniref:histidine phosphatase family protein n=1 Tax=Motiliproteus sediminis TaxID=1468178 RepID=UPI001AF00E29|nr:histidine phosphatase family protein [Motiliproteus sediminis]